MRLLPVLLLACAGGADSDSGSEAATFSVVSFNTGTTDGLPHDADTEDGYTSAEAAVSNDYYGDGLAWPVAVEAARAWFAAQQPDVVGFQEIFWAGDCPNIPSEHQAGWFCEGWSEGDPTVAQHVLGDGYQIACHPGKPDKCVAVREAFGTIAGCDGPFCLDGLTGAEIDGCGSGSRVAFADIDRVDGSRMRVVHVHGSSGLTTGDQQCRTMQFHAAFAFAEAPTVLLGDLNTDPGRWTDTDLSAAAFAEGAAEAGLSFATAVGPDAEPSYAGVVNIDHVLSDTWSGSCATAGITEGHPDVLDATYFDHHPVRCELQ